MTATPPRRPWWPDTSLSLSTQLDLERGRRLVPRMHRHELEQLADSLLLAHAHQQSVIKQAIGRIAELEAREALRDGPEPRHLE